MRDATKGHFLALADAFRKQDRIACGVEQKATDRHRVAHVQGTGAGDTNEARLHFRAHLNLSARKISGQIVHNEVGGV